MRFDENMRLEPKIANIVNTQKSLVGTSLKLEGG